MASGRPGTRLTKLVVALLTLLTAGCSSLPGTSTALIDDQRIEYAQVDRGTAPVVFENGLGATMAGWEKVLADISKDSTTFVYDRPGNGNSAAAGSPRDGAHVVDELRTLLRSRGLQPPYVLVGHSLGGLYMQYFARRYPDEVAGLVLVDSTHPNQGRGKGAPENWPFWARMIFKMSPAAVKDEMGLVNSTGDGVLALPAYTGRTVILFSAQAAADDRSELARDANEKRLDLLRMYPGAKAIGVDSGHFIQWEKPEAVVAAIREVQPYVSHIEPATLK